MFLELHGYEVKGCGASLENRGGESGPETDLEASTELGKEEVLPGGFSKFKRKTLRSIGCSFVITQVQRVLAGPLSLFLFLFFWDPVL